MLAAVVVVVAEEPQELAELAAAVTEAELQQVVMDLQILAVEAVVVVVLRQDLTRMAVTAVPAL
jgi:hypothetical protein